MLFLLIAVISYMGFAQSENYITSEDDETGKTSYIEQNVQENQIERSNIKVSKNYINCEPNIFIDCVKLADEIIDNRSYDIYVEAGLAELYRQCDIKTFHVANKGFKKTYARLKKLFYQKYTECANVDDNGMFSRNSFSDRIKVKKVFENQILLMSDIYIDNLENK